MLTTQVTFHCAQSIYLPAINATSKSDACKACCVLSRNMKCIFVYCPDPKRVESFLKGTIAFSESIEDGDQVLSVLQAFQSDAQVRCMHAGQ